MELLMRTKWVLTWLSIFPLDEFSSKWKMVAVIMVTLVTFATSLASFIANLLFFGKFWKINPIDSLFAACAADSFCSTTYVLVAAFFLRHQFSAIFDELSAIYDASKCIASHSSFVYLLNQYINLYFDLDEDTNSKGFLIRANSKSEWLWTIIMKFIGIVLANMMITPIIPLLSSWFETHTFNSGYHSLQMM